MKPVAFLLAILLMLGTIGAVTAGQPGPPSAGLGLYKQAFKIAETQGQAAADAWVAKRTRAEQRDIAAVHAWDLAHSPIESSAESYLLPPLTKKPSEEPVNARSASLIPALASGCWGPNTHYKYKKSLITGGYFWRMAQQFRWCGDGTWITWHWCYAWVANTGYGWYYAGSIAYCWITIGGKNWSGVEYFSQFSFCTEGGCILNDNPWIKQYGGGNGYYARSSGVG